MATKVQDLATLEGRPAELARELAAQDLGWHG